MGDDPQPAVPLPRWDPYGSNAATFWRDVEMPPQLKAQRDQTAQRIRETDPSWICLG